MKRFRYKDAVKIAELVGKHDYYEVIGNDVFCWDLRTRMITKQITVTKSMYTEQEWPSVKLNWISESEREIRELEEEEQELHHRLKWTFFRPIYEWRLCQQINELKSKIVWERQHIEELRQKERPTWQATENKDVRVTYHRCAKVWHVNCETTPIIEDVDQERDDAKLSFDPINASIIMALTETRLDQRIKAVDRFVVDCEKNHKGRFKVFLDTSREGRQLKMIGCTFEDLLVI